MQRYLAHLPCVLIETNGEQPYIFSHSQIVLKLNKQIIYYQGNVQNKLQNAYVCSLIVTPNKSFKIVHRKIYVWSMQDNRPANFVKWLAGLGCSSGALSRMFHLFLYLTRSTLNTLLLPKK
jgi:hypothetical protein